MKPHLSIRHSLRESGRGVVLVVEQGSFGVGGEEENFLVAHVLEYEQHSPQGHGHAAALELVAQHTAPRPAPHAARGKAAQLLDHRTLEDGPSSE